MAASNSGVGERELKDGEEIEVKLVAHDAEVFDELAGLTQLGGYALHTTAGHAIRDRYWDTPDGRLLEARTSFRLRLQDGLPKFTIKGAGSMEGGLSRHRELEVDADPTGWRVIGEALAREGVRLPDEPAGGDPAAWLAGAGLEVRQDRNTRRRVLIASRASRAVAELALDQTTYQLGIYDVGFREIEVESLTGEIEHVVAIGRALQERFGARIAPSEQHKYARGRDLARRLLA